MVNNDSSGRSPKGGLNRRRFLVSVGATGLLGATAGCSGDGGSSGDGDSDGGSSDGSDGSDDGGGDSAEPQSFQAAASHYPIVPSSLIFPVSDQERFYAEHNVQLDEVTSFGGGGTTIRGVVTGGIPVAGGSAAGAANSFMAGAPVHIIANVDEPPPIDVVTLADSDIESIQDLQGKKVGFTNPGSVSQQLLAGSIARADGISLDDVTLQAMGGLGETITGINEGIIDAGWSNITVSIPKVQAGDWKRIYGTWEYITIPNLVLLAGQQTIEEQPEMLQGIVDAHAKSGDFCRNNTDEVASIWADLYDNVDQDLALQVLEKKIEISDVGVWTNSMQKDTIDQLEQAMQLSGMIDEEKSLPWEDILDQRFLSDEEKIDF